MTSLQSILTIAAVVLGTVVTRFLPFLLFPDRKELPPFIRYLGKVLPYAVMGLLVVYSLKDVTILAGNHGVPEAIALLFLVILHLWKKNMLLSIAGGTMLYMILIQTVFG